MPEEVTSQDCVEAPTQPKQLSINLEEISTEVVNVFKTECDGLLSDIQDKYKDDLQDLIKRAAPAYLRLAKAKMANQEVDKETTELIELYEAELTQYKAIAALEFSERFKKAAIAALQIVANVAVKAILAGIVI